MHTNHMKVQDAENQRRHAKSDCSYTTEEGLMESLKFGVIFLVMLACVYLLGGGR